MLISEENATHKTVLNLNLVTFGALQIFLYTLIPLLIIETKLELTSLIVAFSIGTLCFIPGALFWTKFGDQGKTHFALTWNMFFLFLSVLLFSSHFYFSFTQEVSFAIFLLGRIIWGLGASGIPGLTQYLRLRDEGKKLKNLMGNSLALNIGRSLGPCLAFLPVKSSSLLIGLSIFLGALFILNAVFMTNDSRRTADIKSKTTIMPEMGPVLPALFIALILTGITGYVHTGLAAFIQKAFLLSAGEASAEMGKLLFFGSIVMVVSLFFGRKVVNQNWKGLLAAGTLSLSSGLTLFIFAPTTTFLYFNFALICLGISFLNPGIIMLLENLSTDNSYRGERLGQLNAVNTLGFAIGGLLLSLTSERFGMICVVLAFILGFTSLRTLLPFGRKEVVWRP